jgi:hypothetical protein
MRLAFVVACTVFTVATAHAQKLSDDDYTKRVSTAAPPAIIKDASIARMDGSTMKTMKSGTNGFTCMLAPEDNAEPMCMDANAMEWLYALGSHATAPPDKTGFVYMLAGDTGASNTDPFATGPKPDNHWVKTGSHVMIVGSGAKAMPGYTKTPDADPTKPYVMWAGTPYEHLMLPVK